MVLKYSLILLLTSNIIIVSKTQQGFNTLNVTKPTQSTQVTNESTNAMFNDSHDGNGCGSPLLNVLNVLNHESVQQGISQKSNLKHTEQENVHKHNISSNKLFLIIVENHSIYKLGRHKVFRGPNCKSSAISFTRYNDEVVKDILIVKGTDDNSTICPDQNCGICGTILWNIEQVNGHM